MSQEQGSTGQARSGQEQIRACLDVLLPLELEEEAQRLAIEENPANGRETTDPQSGQRAVVVTSKLWQPGRTLRVRFLGGSQTVRDKVKRFANEWSQHTSLKFDFGDHEDAEIRIAFVPDGSWSYIGTDALAVAKNEPTMNFGWLTEQTGDDEYSRVVIHEFGHAIGMPHEHQNPAAGIPWNKEAVYRYYTNPPNNWTRDQVDSNLFATYSKTQTQFTDFDKESIMLYPIPREFVTDPSFEVGMNTKLSQTDKEFMRKIYP